MDRNTLQSRPRGQAPHLLPPLRKGGRGDLLASAVPSADKSPFIPLFQRGSRDGAARKTCGELANRDTRLPYSKALLTATLCAIVALAGACAKGPPAGPPAEVVVVHRDALTEDPNDAAWRNVAVFPAPLVLQDMVEPRLTQLSTTEVSVKAVTDGNRLAFRLEWKDQTNNDLPGVSKFSDGCAVQLPAQIQADVPAPQMGEPTKQVEISYWRAFWQSAVDGRDDTIKALYPNATVDLYPFQSAPLKPGSDEQREMEKRYAPARALGNDMAGPRDRPVQDLIAEGPGTIRPAPSAKSNGRGVRTADGWAVVISRPIPAGLTPGARSQVAFAVWEGSHEEGGARKMRSVWVPIAMEGGK